MSKPILVLIHVTKQVVVTLVFFSLIKAPAVELFRLKQTTDYSAMGILWWHSRESSAEINISIIILKSHK